MLSALLLLVGLAAADGIHTGVPVRGIEGFGAPSFQTTQTGWSAVVLDGFVRVYVGRTEAEAQVWVERMRRLLRREKPTPNANAFTAEGITDVHGDGTKLILFRDGNVGICVRHKTNARPWALKAHSAIVDTAIGWPTPARLETVDGTWRVIAPPDAAQISFEGGKLVPGHGLRFSEQPAAVIVWDAYGRSVRMVPKPPAPVPAP
jgi:hypothetical protein